MIMWLEHYLRSAVIAPAVCMAFFAFSCSGSRDTRTTITVMHWGGYMEKEWRELVIAPFEKAHPDIHVELTIVPYGMYAQRLQASSASGAAPGDVLMVDDWLAAELMARGFGADIEDRVAKDLGASNFVGDVLDEWRAFGGGRLHGVPFSGGATVLYYNRDIFDRAHLAYPDTTWTYDDMARAAARLTSRGDDAQQVWGVLLDNGGFSGYDTYVTSNGAAELSSDKRTPMLASDAMVRATQKYVDMVVAARVAPIPSSIGDQWGPVFASGHAAMALVGDHFRKQFAERFANWGFTLPPKGTAGRRSRRFDDGFIIPATSQHQDAAWEFVKWVVTFPPQTGITKIMEKSTPMWKPLAASSAWRSEFGEANAAMLEALFRNETFSDVGRHWNEWRDNVLVPEIDNAMLGRKSVPQALSDAQRETEKVMSR